MKKIGTATLNAFSNRILNIHPGIIPEYGGQGMYGLNIHKAVIENAETMTGITIHLVDGEYDHGRILNETRIPVMPTDTPESLQKRVLSLEHIFFVKTLQLIADREIAL